MPHVCRERNQCSDGNAERSILLTRVQADECGPLAAKGRDPSTLASECSPLALLAFGRHPADGGVSKRHAGSDKAAEVCHPLRLMPRRGTTPRSEAANCPGPVCHAEHRFAVRDEAAFQTDVLSISRFRSVRIRLDARLPLHLILQRGIAGWLGLCRHRQAGPHFGPHGVQVLGSGERVWVVVPEHAAACFQRNLE